MAIQSKNPNQIITAPLLNPVSLATRYYARIEPMIDAMIREAQKEMLALFDGPLATDAGLPTMDNEKDTLSEKAKKLINKLTNKYIRIFNRDVTGIVSNMLQGANRASASSLNSALKEVYPAMTVKTDFLTDPMKVKFEAMTIENVSLFKTIPQMYFKKVESAVMTSIIAGEGMKDLRPFFEKHSTGEKNYAINRCNDQTRNAFQSINMDRMKRLGIKKVKFHHSHGQNDPRKRHQELDGMIFDIDKPPYLGDMYHKPVYGFGGVLPNCACFTSMVIDLDEDDD